MPIPQNVCWSCFAHNSKLVLFIVTVLPYGGHDGDGEEKCVGEGPLIAPALHLGFIFFLFSLIHFHLITEVFMAFSGSYRSSFQI